MSSQLSFIIVSSASTLSQTATGVTRGFVADRLIENLGRPAFAWGRADLQTSGRSRDRYLQALRAADGGDFAPLVAFARTEE